MNILKKLNNRFHFAFVSWQSKLAARMEAKLAKNRHKGDREGWLKDHPWNLVERVLDETVELQQCFSGGLDGVTWANPDDVANECADVANFCMMVADRVTEQESANAQAQRLAVNDKEI